MGLGGHLMWTAVARNIKNNFNQTCSISDDDLIFKNNPLFQNGSYKLNLGASSTIYNEQCGTNRVRFKTKKHIVEWISNQLGMTKNISLSPEIYLTEKEKDNANNLIKSFPKHYACIEPHSKTSWMRSRTYSFKKYQNIVNALKDKIQFVQIGAPKSKNLDNAIHTNGRTTFRETAEILKNAAFFLSTEGGLVHLSRAAGTKSFTIYTSYQYPSITMYPENTMIDIALYRDEILGYKDHDLYKKERDLHDESEIIELIKKEY